MSRFDIAFQRVIGHEGGYTNDSRDRGNWTSGKIGVGKLNGTKYGISAMSYPSVDIKNLTLAQAKAIYERDFWIKNKCDKLPIGIDFLMFDAAINHGGTQAAKFLQQAAGSTPDGIVGPKTLQAVSTAKTDALATAFCVARMIFYTQISTFPTYRNGWTRRAFETHSQAIKDIQ